MKSEKISLNDRAPGPGSDSDKKMMSIEKRSLSQRIERAFNGETFDNIDMLPYRQELMKSSKVTLDKIVTSRKVDEITSKLSRTHSETQLQLKSTYGELAWMSVKSFEYKLSRPRKIFPNADMTDNEWEIFLLLWESLMSEYCRRYDKRVGNDKRSGSPDYLDISDLFPAFRIPLPLYFQAAADCCKNPERKEYLQMLYKEIYRPFLNRCLPIKGKLPDIRKVQQSWNSGYYDPVTMIAVIAIAGGNNIIGINEYAKLSYDIVVTPFLFNDEGT